MAWTNRTKPTTVFTGRGDIENFLLINDTDFLLINDTDKLIISIGTDWSNRTSLSAYKDTINEVDIVIDDCDTVVNEYDGYIWTNR